jgi:hypothetical protein
VAEAKLDRLSWGLKENEPLSDFVVRSVSGGLLSRPKQQVAACELQANQHARTNDDIEIRDRELSEETELCMRAHGYELVEDNCPFNLRTGQIRSDPEAYSKASEADKARMNLEIGNQITRLLDIQKIVPECYEPMGWLGKKTLRFERRFGLVPRL